MQDTAGEARMNSYVTFFYGPLHMDARGTLLLPKIWSHEVQILRGESHAIMAQVIDCEIIVSEFEF